MEIFTLIANGLGIILAILALWAILWQGVAIAKGFKIKWSIHRTTWAFGWLPLDRLADSVPCGIIALFWVALRVEKRQTRY